MKEASVSFSDLPVEMQLHIMLFASRDKNSFHSSRVSKDWYSVMHMPEMKKQIFDEISQEQLNALLHKAVEKFSLKAVQFLVEQGADLFLTVNVLVPNSFQDIPAQNSFFQRKEMCTGTVCTGTEEHFRVKNIVLGIAETRAASALQDSKEKENAEAIIKYLTAEIKKNTSPEEPIASPMI